MKNYDNKNIIIGIGNSGRKDDGLGWAFLDEIKSKLPSHFDIEYRYQLQIEDAELISTYKTVYFVDAHKDQFDKGYVLKECHPKSDQGFTTHQLAPETVLYISKKLYNTQPQAYILGISGQHFDLQIGLTEMASSNLSKAITFFDQSVVANLEEKKP